MNTFRRLNLGIVLQTGATLVVAAQAVSLRNPLLTGALCCVHMWAAVGALRSASAAYLCTWA